VVRHAGAPLDPVRRALLVLEAGHAREGFLQDVVDDAHDARAVLAQQAAVARTDTSVPMSVTATAMPIEVFSTRSSSLAISAITSRWSSRT
jgi:hypothetical protein